MARAVASAAPTEETAMTMAALLATPAAATMRGAAAALVVKIFEALLREDLKSMHARTSIITQHGPHPIPSRDVHVVQTTASAPPAYSCLSYRREPHCTPTYTVVLQLYTAEHAT